MPRRVPHPNPRNRNGARRRAARAAVLATEDTCALCGGWVNKALHYLDDGAPEVDELVPVSLGGSPYDRANLRLAHRGCNRRRGNGTRTSTTTLPLRTSQSW